MEGYDKVAALMASDPGISIYRRFARLNAKNLLYFQAELVHLEIQLDNIIERDRKSEMVEKKDYPISLWHLKRSIASEEGGKQWRKVLEIREVLDKYNKALIQQERLLKLCAPEQSDLDILHGWMKQEKVFFKLRSEMLQWSSHEDDLVALHARHDGEDHFTRWMYSSFIPWFHRIWSREGDSRHHPGMRFWRYSDQKIKSFTRASSIIVSAVLPASAMVILYYIRSTAVRLIVIFVYNLLFSFSLGLMVEARPIEIFAAATAFAAVQVALITNAPGTNTG